MKKIPCRIIFIICLISQILTLCGCGQSKNNKTVELIDERYVFEDEPDLRWMPLEKLDTYPEFRKEADSVFETVISGENKSGCLYTNSYGQTDPNNTLIGALHNDKVVSILTDSSKVSLLKKSLDQIYSDLKEEDTLPAVINTYFDLLPDESDVFNGSVSLSRKEAMAMVMRAVTPVTDDGLPADDSDFKMYVGKGTYTNYAAPMDQYVYLSTFDLSLDKDQFKEDILRGEFVYLVLNCLGGTEYFDGSSAVLEDCKNGGRITDKSEMSNRLEFLLTLLMDSEGYAPEEIYSSLSKANELGVIESVTGWERSITKSEAIQILTDLIIAYSNDISAAESIAEPDEISEIS